MPTRFTSLATKLGIAIGSTLVVGTTLVVGSSLVVGTTGLFGTSVTTQIVYSTGGLLPVTANLTESNYGGDGPGDGSGSGWSIQNPYSEKLLCKSFVVNTTTAPTDGATTVDVSRGTGALTVSGVASGITLFDRLPFAVGTTNSTGSLLTKSLAVFSGTSTGTILYPLNFILDEAGGTNDYFLLTARGSGTGGGLVADVHAECYSLD